jgi:beta-glucuronidase
VQITSSDRTSVGAGFSRRRVRLKADTTHLEMIILAVFVATVVASPHGTIQDSAAVPATINLGGEWRFAIDPTSSGETDRWFAADLDDRRWDRVNVPHCWPLDPRYQYTGRAWYRRAFATPRGLEGRHVRIEFDAVFARARVWLNGLLLGTHEGGYTPFGFDVAGALASDQNALVLEVDNGWSTRTMPGARPGSEPTARVYPWWDYGGIVRPVRLVVSPAVYVQKQRVTAVPDLRTGAADVEATTWVRNTTNRPAAARLRFTLLRLEGDREVPLTISAATGQASRTAPPGGSTEITWRTTLPREAVQLWGLDRPTLYRLRAELTTESAAADVPVSTFGIRRFETQGTELHLNGRPVRLGGANRPSDDPKFGLLEPTEVVERDIRLMKAAGMELQRIIHYAAPPALLDLADRLGLLIVGEPGNWNLQPAQLDDAAMRADFRNQMRELVERDWNHPSVIAWSVGNEYASDTPSGVRWTKDMAAFVRQLDPSRLVTFASYRAFRPELQRPEDEGSHFVDFVSINTYAAPAQLGGVLDLVHQRYPQRPVVVSEFGLRADKVRTEEERRRYFRDAIGIMRQRSFVAGASVWTLQDYRSRYPDTAPNGYRPWGLVDHLREPRDAYHAVALEFATARVVASPISREGGRLITRITVEARPDFPARDLSGLILEVAARDATAPIATRPLPALVPGQRVEVVFDSAGDVATTIRIIRPDGSVMDHVDRIDSASAFGAARR